MYSIEEIYGVELDEFCEATGLTPEQLIDIKIAEIRMLERNRIALNRKLRESTQYIGTDSMINLVALITYVDELATKKKRKLEKYRRALESKKKRQ